MKSKIPAPAKHRRALVRRGDMEVAMHELAEATAHDYPFNNPVFQHKETNSIGISFVSFGS
ncbi:MAG TPA: hypothetical protein VFH95_05410 [Candidatus Kapabacteria bacterium]|nr:hypothetical protein [Candidatus Kapabacteria bacterium]